jgi:hypothetical protein
VTGLAPAIGCGTGEGLVSWSDGSLSVAALAGWLIVHVAVPALPRIVACCPFESVTVKVRVPGGGFSLVWIVTDPSREPAGTVAVPVPPL